jgi:hypothetical protein
LKIFQGYQTISWFCDLQDRYQKRIQKFYVKSNCPFDGKNEYEVKMEAAERRLGEFMVALSKLNFLTS